MKSEDLELQIIKETIGVWRGEIDSLPDFWARRRINHRIRRLSEERGLPRVDPCELSSLREYQILLGAMVNAYEAETGVRLAYFLDEASQVTLKSSPGYTAEEQATILKRLEGTGHL